MAVGPGESRDDGVAPLKGEAADWAARLAIGPVSDVDWHAFEAWRRSSPAHEEAFRSLASFVDELRALGQSAATQGVSLEPGAAAAPSPSRSLGISRRAALTGGTLAASIAAVAGVGYSPLGLWPSLPELLADARTGMGERATFTPRAGVTVELNARSSVSRTAEGIVLVAGQIFVALAGMTRDFVLEAGPATIATRAAMLDVQILDGVLDVACLAGAIVARHGAQAEPLARGQGLRIAPGGDIERRTVDPAVVTAWRRGLLIFEGTPLAEVIAQVNRYYPGRILLSGAALQARPVTGVFHTAQIALAVPQIQNLTRTRATRLPGGIVVLE